MAVNVKTIESKKTQKATITKTSTQSKQAQSFFNGVKTEFKKITWTNKEELQTYTKIVVGATFFCGMGVYFVDLSIRACLATLETITLFVFG